MRDTLFPVRQYPEYLLDVTFSGPSFDGMMEIGALAKEIQGLQDVLRIALHSLKKNKRAQISLGDLEIYVEAFEKGSFRKRVKVFNKVTKEYQPLIELAVLVVMIFQTIPQYAARDVKNPSAEMIAQIKDEVILELLGDRRFISAAANVVGSVAGAGDMCTFRAPTDIQAVIDPRASTAIIGIASQEEEQSDDGEYFEQLSGRITRVDLDASKRHVGFKVDGEGATIDATFTDKPSDEVMNSLLGEWAQIKGTVKYVGGQRNHIDIQEYNIVKQKQIEFAGQI